MKKLLIFVIMISGLLIRRPVFASGTRLEPPVHPVLPEGVYDFHFEPEEVHASSAGITTVVPAVLGQRAQWTVNSTGSQFSFQLFETDPEDPNELTAVYICQTASEDNTFSYTFHEPGEYYLYCFISDGSGEEEQTFTYFTVEPREGVETVTSRVTEIVQECRSQVDAGDEYETALWLHDWITTNSYYDETYSYYGADAILFYGTGVCDSYSKLYCLLLEEAGFEAGRVFGDVYGGPHAWNIVRINGEWCMADPTWDDPASGDDIAVSGYETREYFGLNTELMSLDHYNYTPAYPWTSLDNCAVRREGTYRVWMSHVLGEMTSALRDGEIEGTMDTQGIIMADEYGSYYDDPEAVDRGTRFALIIMASEEWDFKGGRKVYADFKYPSDGYDEIAYALRMSGVDMILPEDTVEIGEEAFMDAERVIGVKIPESVQRIGAGAFSGCDALMWVVVLSEDAAIDPSAFAGVPDGFVIVSSPDSTARGFAQEHAITWKELA